MAQLSLADHLRRARAAIRPASSDEMRGRANLAHLNRFLARLRPIRWPAADPLGGGDVAFVLGINRSSFSHIVRVGLLPARQERRRYWVKRADLEAYIQARIDEADRLGLDVPNAARKVLR